MPSLNFALMPTVVTDSTVLASAAAVIRAGLHEKRAAAELSFSDADPDFGFFVFAGAEVLCERLERHWLTDADRAHLRMQSWIDPRARELIETLRCNLDLDAPPEGSLAFAREPLLTLEGPLLAVLLVAPLVVSTLSFATIAATRAARLVLAASAFGASDEVVDASSSIAPGDMGLLAARAAHVGGCTSTTNIAAATMLGIPLFRGIAPDVERLCRAEAADAWGTPTEGGPKRLLSGSGPKNTEIELLERRRTGERGTWLAHELSGDWGPLGSAESGAGRGSAAAVRYDIVALEQGRSWSPRLGLGSDAAVLPGRKQVVRYTDANGAAIADRVQLTSERVPSSAEAQLIERPEPGFSGTLPAGLPSAPLQRAVLRGGKRAAGAESIAESRRRAAASLAAIDPAVKRLGSPRRYRVGISRALFDLRASLLLQNA